MHRSVSLLSVLLLSLAALLWSQSITASLEGIVRDPSGALVAGAKVTVINTGTNAKTEITSNSEGFFVAPLLQPGTYAFTVEAPGFKTYRREGLRLDVTQAAKLAKRNRTEFYKLLDRHSLEPKLFKTPSG